VVTFTTPTPGALLCPSGAAAAGCIDDNNAGTAGWQGNLTVSVTVNRAAQDNVVLTFTDGTTTLGTATTDPSGNASLAGITIPDGLQTIVATTDNVPGAGVGSGGVTVTVDTAAPNAPTGLTVIIPPDNVSRRKTTMQLSWTSPSDADGVSSVAGFQVRYAKVPITTANFNDSTVTTAVTYAGTPPGPGVLTGLTVSPLYIENGYYFAVAAVNGVGTLSTITATPSGGSCTCGGQCCAAHFNVTTIPSTSGTNEQFGFSVSADGDVDGDGLSDILVGTAVAGRAYLFLGSSTFAAGPPSVVFSGASAGFGFTVAQIGDIDNDGLADIAIGNPINSGRKVYIYKGRRTWPATLTDAQADYVLSTDSTYGFSQFGYSIARLGDFTGDGIDDIAVGAPGFNGGIGRVVIIPGKASGFASVSLPDTTNAIVIDGDATLGQSNFGYRVLGLGHFYSISTGTTLVVSGTGDGNGPPADFGHVYAFHGQTGTSGAISIASADSVLVGPGDGAAIGQVLVNLGTMLNGFPGVGIGNPLDSLDVPGANTSYLTSGTPATGPFANKVFAYLGTANASGGLLIGGGVSGRDVGLSLIGSATPDLVLGGEVAGTFTISDGAKLGSKGSRIEVGSTAEVVVSLPSSWLSGEGDMSIIPDLNGDGFPDLCIGSQSQPGAILVYW
jgi:FG-GAP-like repeat/FG-GAP repeat